METEAGRLRNSWFAIHKFVKKVYQALLGRFCMAERMEKSDCAPLVLPHDRSLTRCDGAAQTSFSSPLGSEKSCGAVVWRAEGNARLYLILHYSEGHWDFPKGHVEAGEDEEQTARREIQEEIGITQLEFSAGFRKSIAYRFKRGSRYVPKEVVFFLAKTNEAKVKLSDEHTEYEWLAYKAAEKKLTYENARMILGEAERFLLSH